MFMSSIKGEQMNIIIMRGHSPTECETTYGSMCSLLHDHLIWMHNWCTCVWRFTWYININVISLLG